MQLDIKFTDNQVQWIKDAINLLLIPFVGWLIRQSRSKINEIITENVNRIRDEIMADLEVKLKTHEAAELDFIRAGFAKLGAKEL